MAEQQRQESGSNLHEEERLEGAPFADALEEGPSEGLATVFGVIHREDDGGGAGSAFAPPPAPCLTPAAACGDERAGEGASEGVQGADDGGSAGAGSDDSSAASAAFSVGEKRAASRIPFGDGERNPKNERRAFRMILVVGVALALVLAAVLAATVLSGNPDDGSASKTRAAGTSGASGEGEAVDEGSRDSSKEEEPPLSEAESAAVSAAAEAAFAALSADEDGRFTGFVQELIDAYDEGASGGQSYGLSDLGLTAEELSTRLRNGFSCEVINVDAYGSMAWVDVDVTARSLVDLAEEFTALVSEGESDAASQDEADESSADAFENAEAYKEYLKENFLRAIDSTQPRTVSMTVTLERVDDVWTLTDSTAEYLLGTAWYNRA